MRPRDEHDDQVGAPGHERRRLGVDRLDDRGDLDVGDAAGAHQRRELLRDSTDEPDLHLAELPDPGRRNRRLPRGTQLQVRGDVLPLGTAERVGHGVEGAITRSTRSS